MKFGIFGPHWLQFPVVFPHDTGQLHRTVKGARWRAKKMSPLICFPIWPQSVTGKFNRYFLFLGSTLTMLLLLLAMF